MKSKANAVVASLARAARPSEKGQGDGATLDGEEKEKLENALGRFDHNGNKVEEKCTDIGGY